MVITKGNELKLVFSQQENEPSNFENLDFDHFYLQPLDDEHQNENISKSVNHCLSNPKWKLSLQTHKIIGMQLMMNSPVKTIALIAHDGKKPEMVSFVLRNKIKLEGIETLCNGNYRGPYCKRRV